MIKPLSQHAGATSSVRSWLTVPLSLNNDIARFQASTGLDKSKAIRSLLAMGLGRRDEIEMILREARPEMPKDQPVTVSEQILTVLEAGGRWTVPDITEAVVLNDPGVNRNTVAQILCRMARRGEVTRGDGLYWLDEKGN